MPRSSVTSRNGRTPPERILEEPIPLLSPGEAEIARLLTRHPDVPSGRDRKLAVRSLYELEQHAVQIANNGDVETRRHFDGLTTDRDDRHARSLELLG
jgi:hypothetical protein